MTDASCVLGLGMCTWDAYCQEGSGQEAEARGEVWPAAVYSGAGSL